MRYFIEDMYVSAQVKEYYSESDTSSIHKSKPKLIRFPESFESILVDDYIALPTLREVINEIVPYVRVQKKKDNFLSKILTKLTQKPSKFITTMLIGNNIALVIYGYFMGDLLMQFLSPSIDNEFVLLLIQTLISTLIILITAEFLPKAIFRIFANETLKLFAIPAYFFFIMFFLISGLITQVSNFFLRVFFNTKEDPEKLVFSKAELGHFISEQMETVDEDIDSEIQIFQNALDFHNVKAREAMIPRTEIVAVDVHESLNNLRQIFIDTGLSKIIVLIFFLSILSSFLSILNPCMDAKNGS